MSYQPIGGGGAGSAGSAGSASSVGGSAGSAGSVAGSAAGSAGGRPGMSGSLSLGLSVRESRLAAGALLGRLVKPTLKGAAAAN